MNLKGIIEIGNLVNLLEIFEDEQFHRILTKTMMHRTAP